MRRGREAAGDADPRLAQLADHFAEGSVLAADRLDIGHSQVFEAGDEGGRQVVDDMGTLEGREEPVLAAWRRVGRSGHRPPVARVDPATRVERERCGGGRRIA